MQEIDEKTIIMVDDGETFEGTADHWRDCFFSNPTKANIEDFCKLYGWKVEFVNVQV